MDSPSRTPTTSPPKKTIRMTQGQKQALIDNLQLEITERARKLRAQYAQQAASLRSRLEIRLHRIPTSLRKANMGDLVAKYNAMLENKNNAPSTTGLAPAKKVENKAATNTTSSSPVQTRGMKRKRSALLPPLKPIEQRRASAAKLTNPQSEHFDKENIPAATAPYTALPNPKKRAKPNAAAAAAPAAATTVTTAPPAKRTTSRTVPPHTKPPPPPPNVAPTPATRTASRALARATSRSKAPPPPSTILSPKSSNVQAPAPAPAPTVKRGKAGAAPAPKKVQAPPSAPVKAAGKKGAPRVQAEAPAGGRRVLRTRK